MLLQLLKFELREIPPDHIILVSRVMLLSPLQPNSQLREQYLHGKSLVLPYKHRHGLDKQIWIRFNSH